MQIEQPQSGPDCFPEHFLHVTAFPYALLH